MSTPVIACLHNLEDAFTGHAGLAIRAAGVELDERRLRDGEPLPALDEVDGLLSLGGEQSVLDIGGDPVVGALPPGAVALHWNEDGFEPPAGAVELLARPAGTTEAFRYGESAWGVQFHPEVDPPGLEGWYRAGLAELGEAGVTEEHARAADARHLPGQHALSSALFGGFARVVAARCVAA